MVRTRYTDQEGSKSRQNVMDSTSNGTDQCQNGSSNLLTPCREQPRLTRTRILKNNMNAPRLSEHRLCLNPPCSRLPRPAFSSTKRTNYAPISFDLQVQVSQGRTSYKKNENYNTRIHGGGGLQLVKPAHEPASSHSKIWASLKKPHEPCPFAAPCGPRRKEKYRSQTSRRGRKTTVVRRHVFPQKPLGSRL